MQRAGRDRSLPIYLAIAFSSSSFARASRNILVRDRSQSGRLQRGGLAAKSLTSHHPLKPMNGPTLSSLVKELTEANTSGKTEVGCRRLAISSCALLQTSGTVPQTDPLAHRMSPVSYRSSRPRYTRPRTSFEFVPFHGCLIRVVEWLRLPSHRKQVWPSGD